MLLILAVHISAICHVDTLIFLSPLNKRWESWRIAKGRSNRRFSDLWVVSRGMGERNRKKIDILYFVNRLLQRLLSPSILHTVLSSLQYPYTEHPKIINFRYPTDIL